jgi:hypothetical protein
VTELRHLSRTDPHGSGISSSCRVGCAGTWHSHQLTLELNTPAAPMAPVFAYHERTKHYPGRFARASAAMDWATQPDPFRRFEGAPLLPLDLVPVPETSLGTSPRSFRETSRLHDSAAPRCRSSCRILWRSRHGNSPARRAGRCESTRRAGISIRPRAISSLGPSRGFMRSQPSITMRRTSTRLN